MKENKGQIPKKDYFRVKNDWWEALTHFRLPGEQMQVLMYIIRRTYGWKRTERPITISEFEKATGINRRNVFRALTGLKAKNLIGVKKDNDRRVRYGFNKYSKTWVGGVKKDTRCQKRHQVGVKKDNDGGVKKDTTPPIIRKNSLKNSLKNTHGWLDLQVWNEFIKHRENGKKKFTDYAQQLAIEKLEELKAAGENPNEIMKQSIQNGWSGLYPIAKKRFSSREKEIQDWIENA